MRNGPLGTQWKSCLPMQTCVLVLLPISIIQDDTRLSNLSLGHLFHFIPYPNSTCSIRFHIHFLRLFSLHNLPPSSSTPPHSEPLIIPTVMNILHLNTFTDKQSFSHEIVQLSFGCYCKSFLNYHLYIRTETKI